MKIKTMYVDAATLDCIQVDTQKKKRRVDGVPYAKYHFAQTVAFSISISISISIFYFSSAIKNIVK